MAAEPLEVIIFFRTKLTMYLESYKLGPRDVIFISGGAKNFDEKDRIFYGADWFAEKYAYLAGYTILVVNANWQQYNVSAGPIRNTEIVRLADEFLFFWDNKSRGTKDTIIKAKDSGKPFTVYNF